MKKFAIISILVGVALLAAAYIWAQSPVVQEPVGQSNTQQVSGAATAVSKTITGIAGYRVQVYGVAAYCSAATSTLTITDGGTTIWSTPSGGVGTTQFAHDWPTPLAAVAGNTVVITLASCGGSNTGTLIVQSSNAQF